MFPLGLVDGILALLSIEWIDRIWCLQESLLARNLVLCCGCKSIAWSNFSYALTYLEDRKKPYGVPLKRLDPWLQLISMRTQFHDSQSAVLGLQKSSLDGYHKSFWLQQYVARCILPCAGCLMGLTVVCIEIATTPHAVLSRQAKSGFVFGLGLPLLIAIFYVFLLWGRATRRVKPIDAIVREIVLRRAAEPQDKVYDVLGILETEYYGLTLPNLDTSSRKLPDLYQALFTRLADKWKVGGRLLFYAKGLPTDDGDKWDGPSFIPNLQSFDRPWIPHPHQRLEVARIGTHCSSISPPRDDLTEPQLAFPIDGLTLTVQVLPVGRASRAHKSSFIKTPMSTAKEGHEEGFSDCQLHNIQLLCQPWQEYKRKKLSVHIKHAIFMDKWLPQIRWKGTAIQPSIYEDMDSHEVKKWAQILDTWRSPSTVRRSSVDSETKVSSHSIQLCNNLATNNRCIFLIQALGTGQTVVANGPSTIETGDEIIKITRYAGDPHLAVRYNRSKGCYEMVGTVVLTAWAGDILTQRRLKRARFSSMVLGWSEEIKNE